MARRPGRTACLRGDPVGAVGRTGLLGAGEAASLAAGEAGEAGAFAVGEAGALETDDAAALAAGEAGEVAAFAAGEAAALARWDAFRHDGLASYGELRDRPDLEGTSSLSVHLRWGEIHPRTLLADLGDSPSHTAFRRQLAWREFYADVLHRDPASARTWLDPRFGGMEHDEGPDADARFAAWCEGRTGYPFVDAGMRQLLAEGWMHNRVRMVTASFLVKDLHLPWQRGARWFMRHLRDADLASNQHGWQWVAGSGTDAAPYVRVFNPVTQGLRFDPDGDYVRRFLPELTDLPGAAAHEPWKHPPVPGNHATRAGSHATRAGGYPPRVVEHAAERAESLRRHANLPRANFLDRPLGMIKEVQLHDPVHDSRS